MGLADSWAFLAARACLARPLVSSELPSQMLQHLEGAVQWLLTAQCQSGDRGIPAFFDLLRRRWAPSYPETSGYAVETLLACASVLGRPDLRQAALGVAEYLLRVRTKQGAVGHWREYEGGPAPPIVFDTGQVIFGWLAAWHETGESAYLEATVRAGDWLVAIQDPSGAWIRNQHQGTVKVIDTRVAWALLQLAAATRSELYVEAARRNLDWALAQQQANGWFRHASFVPSQDPFTHTIAYTAEGLLECGIRLNERRYVEAANRVAHALLTLQRRDGSLASTYDAAWRPTARSSCLTGNCQMALLWLRLHGMSEDRAYLGGAHKAVAFVASTQDLRTANPNIRGAIAGSYPIYGSYARFQYPNWAAKFFIDAVLALVEASGGSGCYSKGEGCKVP